MIVMYYVALRLINKKNMNRLTIFFLAGLFIFYSCKQNEEQKLDADTIVNKSIKASGGDKIDSSVISFDLEISSIKPIEIKAPIN